MLEVAKIYVQDLQVGMYVSNLDRPWLETPYLLQGFTLESSADIHRLRDICDFVYVDTRKSVVVTEEKPLFTSERKRQTPAQIFHGRRLTSYRDSDSWDKEFPRAQDAVKKLSSGIDSLFDRMREGDPLDFDGIKQSVDPMIDSVVRNPDACIWLARLKQQDQYTYQHSLGASIWAVALGRQLGLPRKDLRSLAVGGLLFDVGKLSVDPELLNATRPLTNEEFDQVRSHVVLGVDMVKEAGHLSSDVVDMIAHHHERHDGSGYPDGLKGDAIPVFARIAAIVDCYDAITSHRSYARAMPPSQAIKMLYEWKDIDFQAELVETFIQAIGIYPAGTLVELSTGEVAVVIAEYRSRRLRPKVMVLLDSGKQPLAEVKTIDLLAESEKGDEARIDIVGSLEPDAYGIDMAGISL
ncbi:MAG: HD-GYP domain-containing protein [Halioglobus sp.]